MALMEIRKTTILVVILLFFVLIWPVSLVYAQSIPITISNAMEKVIFDGKWTFPLEWKKSSYDSIRNNSTIHVLRSAHQDEFIYLMLDAIKDTSIDNGKDYAVVCFDTKNDQSAKPDDNDYCFKVILGSDKVETFQGSDESGAFKVVKNHIDLIGIGGTSDENDRYTKVPHGTYEFRIPIKLLQRTNLYGFYVEVFDFSNSITVTWPGNTNLNSNISNQESPDTWGIIYSPDKSLPEYDVPILVLVIGILSSIFVFYRVRKITFIYSN